MSTWRPVLLLILNFIVGGLVSQGVVDPADKDYLVELLADAIGYLIIFITSMVTLYSVIKHPPLHGKNRPVEAGSVKTDPPGGLVSTDTPVTPLPENQPIPPSLG